MVNKWLINQTIFKQIIVGISCLYPKNVRQPLDNAAAKYAQMQLRTCTCICMWVHWCLVCSLINIYNEIVAVCHIVCRPLCCMWAHRCASVPLCLCCCVCLRLWLLTVVERRTFTSCCPPYLPPFFVSQQFRFFFLVLQKHFCFDCCFFSNRALASFPLQQSRNEYVCAKMCWWRSKLFLVAAFLKRAHIIFTANKGGHFNFFISRF